MNGPLILAEIENRGGGANNGALFGGSALLVLWLIVVAVQIFRHRRRTDLPGNQIRPFERPGDDESPEPDEVNETNEANEANE